jgi:hypothetical protein
VETIQKRGGHVEGDAEDLDSLGLKRAIVVAQRGKFGGSPGCSFGATGSGGGRFGLLGFKRSICGFGVGWPGRTVGVGRSILRPATCPELPLAAAAPPRGTRWRRAVRRRGTRVPSS